MLSARAISLRLDGSVDRTQIDKIYVLAKIVTDNGYTEEVYIGVAEPEERGARGMVGALTASLKNTFGDKGPSLMKLVSSIVTDGASVNIGEKAGLWALLQTERSNKTPENEVAMPLLKIWCAVHRSQLAWQSVSSSVVEVKHLFQTLTGISSYMHASGIRTREVKRLAKQRGLVYVHMPAVFEVRWTEFSFALVHAILVSWFALVSYFTESGDSAAKGHLKFLTVKSNLELLTFLADILFVFSRFQQRLQRNTTTIVDMQKAVSKVQEKIAQQKEKPLLGGWHTKFKNMTVTDADGDVFLRGIKLEQTTRRREKHHLYVTDKRDIDAVCNEIVSSLVEFLHQRFSLDDVVTSQLIHFVQFDVQKTDLTAVHKAIAADLDITDLSLEFEEIASLSNIACKPLPELVQCLSKSLEYPNVLTALARILAAKPHSADVERCISANNLLKTSLRSSLDISTESRYLFIHHNLPPVADWNARPSVLRWLLEKKRRVNIPTKAKEQSYFRHVFQEATSTSDAANDDEEECGDEDADCDYDKDTSDVDIAISKPLISKTAKTDLHNKITRSF